MTDTPPPHSPVLAADTMSELQRGRSEYAGVDALELLALAKEIERTIVEASEDEFRWRFESGQATVLSEDSSVFFDTPPDPGRIQRLRLGGSSSPGVWHVVLGEEEFPELYALKREELWLREEAARLRQAAVDAAPGLSGR